MVQVEIMLSVTECIKDKPLYTDHPHTQTMFLKRYRKWISRHHFPIVHSCHECKPLVNLKEK